MATTASRAKARARGLGLRQRYRQGRGRVAKLLHLRPAPLGIILGITTTSLGSIIIVDH